MAEGYVYAYRSRWEHPVFPTKQQAAVWAWMTDTACFADRELKTKFGTVHLKRGQLLIQERTIAKEFGLHRNTVRRLFRDLTRARMCALNKDHKASRAGTIVTIINYEKYQRDIPAELAKRDRKDEETGPQTGPRRDHSGTTREEREIKDNNIPPLIPPQGDGERDKVLEMGRVWNEVCGDLLPRVKSANQSRRRKMLKRLKEDFHGSLDQWRAYCHRIRASNYLTGQVKDWACDFDWVLKPANLTKIIEGNYDNDRWNRSAGRSTTRAAI